MAEWASVSVDDIQQLNPELRRWTTPIRGSDYELTVPAGTADAIRTKLATAAPAELNALQWHVVQPRRIVGDDRAKAWGQPHRPR